MILHYWPISRSETGCLGRRTRSRCWWRGRWPGYHHLATTLSSSLSSQVNFEPNHGWKSHPGVQRVLPRSENKVGNPSKLCFHIFSKILSLRYKVIPKKFDQERIYQYYDSDNPEEVKDQSLIIIVVLIVRLTSWRSASRRRSSSTTRSTRVCSRRSNCHCHHHAIHSFGCMAIIFLVDMTIAMVAGATKVQKDKEGAQGSGVMRLRSHLKMPRTTTKTTQNSNCASLSFGV